LKYQVDCNEEVRQQWFKYKAYKYEEGVKEYLENIVEEKREIMKYLKSWDFMMMKGTSIIQTYIRCQIYV
jgi:hypothetical protein